MYVFFIFIGENKLIYLLNMGYAKKNANGMVESMEFPGVLKKLEFLGVFKKKSCAISMGSCFLILEFLRGVTQVCWISGRKKLVLSGISKIKVTNLKTPGFFFQKSISSTSPVWIFFRIAPSLLGFQINRLIWILLFQFK